MTRGKMLCLGVLASAFTLPTFADCALPTAPAIDAKKNATAANCHPRKAPTSA